MIDSPEHDTQLARLLHDQRRLDLETLRGLLGEARATRPRRGPTLARLLVERGLMPPEEASRWLSSALARPAQPGPPSGRFHVGAPVPGPSPAQEQEEQGEEAPPGAREGWFAGGRVDRFVIERRIGQGGMGAVFAALDEETGERVALKTLTPEAVEDEDLVARFLRETEAQAKVDAHPNVVRIHTLGQAAGRPYAVMELIEGVDLHERLRAGPLPPAEAARMARDLARGLAYLHARGVVHRDLKPANILFDADGTPKLVDFGMAWFAGASQLTRTGQVVGTPAYMAPEQARSQAGVGPWTDVYGLCAVLFAALTGRPPFQAEGMLPTLTKVLEEEPPAPSTLVPDLPPRLEEICLSGLAKDPDARPNAEELGEQLQRFLGGGGPGGASGPGKAALVVPVVAGLAAVLMIGAGVWLALRPAPRPAPQDRAASSSPPAADPAPDPTPRPPSPPEPALTPPAAPAAPGPEARQAWTLGGEQRVEFALRIERPGAEGGYEQRWELSLRPVEGADPEHLAWAVRVDRLTATSRGPGGTSSWDSDQAGDPFAAARGRELGLRLRRDSGAVEELSGTEQLQEQIWAALPDKDDADQRLHTRLYLRGEDSFPMRLDRLLRVFPPPLARTEPWSSERPAEPLQKLPVVRLRFRAAGTGDQVEVRWQGERERVGATRGRRIEGQAVLRQGELVRSEATEEWIGPPADLRLTSSWRRLD